MARKVDPDQPLKKAAAKPAPGDDDLEILHPEREPTIAGRQLVVREYGFVEGLKLRPLYAPMVETLKPVLAEGELNALEDVLDLLAEHADRLPELMAKACDQPTEWVAGLGHEDGHHLLLVWWGVNGPFFVRSAVGQLLNERLRAARCAGVTSTSA
jgi:hypothetical protein